jgi:diacylglycerol O-acyltransferase
MDQLNTLDASFLMAEDSDRHVSLAIGGIAIMEGAAPDYGQLKTILAERIRTVPRCTQVLRSQPFDVSPPKWLDDPNFDPVRHVRRIAVPRPGDDAELFRVVARVLERRLDRDRPLWECWVVEGLKDNRWAILLKIHHCVADGMAAIRILTRLCDRIDGDAFTPAVPVRRAGSAHLRPVPDPPSRNAADDLWRAATALTTAATRTLGGAAELVAGLIRPAAGTSLVGPVTAMRRYHAARVPLADIEQICRKFDVTVNDVALTAITQAFRSVLLQRGEQPRADSLRTLVPVSLRTTSTPDAPGNRISVLLPHLPVEERDPVQQLRTVHSRLNRAKGGGQRQAGSTFMSAGNHVPYLLSSWLIRLLTRLPQRGVVTLATNVAGPRSRLQLLGHNVQCILPIAPIALRLRTGIAVLSYADDLMFGITADYDAAPDVEQLTIGIEQAVAHLKALSQDSVLLFAR